VNQIQPQVQALYFQNLLLILLAVGMIAYFIKVGPARFFEEMMKEERWR